MGLTGKQESTCKEVFALFDRDGDGYIPSRDMPLAIRSTGCNPSEKEMNDLLKGREDHMWTTKEFTDLLTPFLQGKDIAEELAKAFKPFDRDNSGTISSGELKHVMLNLSEMKEHVDLLISEADPTNSGVIKYRDLINLLCA